MSQADRIRWDERYSGRDAPAVDAIGIDPVFAPYHGMFPSGGRVLDIACGEGRAAVWFARRGLDVWGLDVSPVAVSRARDLARRSGVDARCRFDVADLDDGLPAGPSVSVVHCRRFRDDRLDAALAQRLSPGGLLAITALGRRNGTSGSFRVAPGELRAVFSAFADLNVVADGESGDQCWLLAQRITESAD